MNRLSPLGQKAVEVNRFESASAAVKTDPQIPIPYLAPANWGDAEPLARLAVKDGRFYVRGAAHVVRAGHQVMPGSHIAHGQDHWTLSMPANRRTAAELSWLATRYPMEVAESFEEFRQLALEHARRAHRNADLPPVTNPPGFRGDLTVYPWQPEDVAWMKNNPRTLNGIEMGLGKTIETIAAIAECRAFPALIVVPPHLQLQWIKELGRFLEIDDEGLLPGIGRIPANKAVHRIKGLSPYTLPPAPIYLTHYGLLRAWAEELCLVDWPVVVFDECQELRIPGSQKYSAAHAIAARAQRAWGLSGTPIYNYGDEIWAIMDALDRGCLGTLTDFTVQWCDSGQEKIVTKPRQLHDYLHKEGLLFRRRKAELLPWLPPKRRAVVDMAMDDNVYRREIAEALKLARNLRTWQSWQFQRDSILKIEVAARQAAGLAKVDSVIGFVSSLVEAGEAPVIYAHHHGVHDALTAALKPYNPVKVTGRESASKKFEAVERFAEGQAGVIIIGLRSSAGLDGLQARGTCCVFAELDWSPAVHSQAEDRLHRIGAAEGGELPCYYLVSSATYDQEVLEVLGVKAGQFTELMDDPFPDPETEEKNKERILGRIKSLIERLQEEAAC